MTKTSTIFNNEVAFAALKVDGSVVTWGDQGGDSSSVADKLKPSDDGTIQVKQIFSTRDAFAH